MGPSLSQLCKGATQMGSAPVANDHCFAGAVQVVLLALLAQLNGQLLQESQRGCTRPHVTICPRALEHKDTFVLLIDVVDLRRGK